METMIPKKIHYCWFGRGEKKQLLLDCIESWKLNLPDYEIIEWNEDNFDIHGNPYVRQAYESKKWAFVSDYVRLWAIYHQGGIYLDTDVEVKKSLDSFLKHDFFTGFESWEFPFTATFGAKKGNAIVKRLLDEYDNLQFKQGEKLQETTNTTYVTNIFIQEYGVKCDGIYQELRDGIVIYPSEYFTLDTNTEHNYTTHHFDGSWYTGSMNYKRFVAIKCKYQKIWWLVNIPIKLKRKLHKQNVVKKK